MKLNTINLKVLLVDSDYYALQMINSYLAWDRRTRVTAMAESIDEMWEKLNETPLAELPDAIIIDSDHAGGPHALKQTIQTLRKKIENVAVYCLAQFADLGLIEAAIEAGARGYFLKGEVRLQIAWAVVYGIEYDFILTGTIGRIAEHAIFTHYQRPFTLPKRREYPELTERIRQAIELCVVRGMPAHLAADEMGISLHTIRSYIKEGYRILEAYDETEYPTDMSPQERAFMRLTRIKDENDDTK